MLETKKIDDLFCVLRIMTRLWTVHPKAAPLLIMWRLLNCSLSGLVLTVIAYSWLPALWRRFGITPSELHDALFVVGCLFIAFFVVFMTTIIVGLFYIAWHREELVPYLCPKNELHRDAEFITQLLAFDKATLALMACFSTLIVGCSPKKTSSQYSLGTCGSLGYFQL